MPKAIDLAGFEKLGPGTFLLDFTAKWCGPCKVMNPVLDVLAAEYKGRVDIVAIDVDDEPLLAQQLRRAVDADVRASCAMAARSAASSAARPRAFVAGVLDRALAGDVAIAAP